MAFFEGCFGFLYPVGHLSVSFEAFHAETGATEADEADMSGSETPGAAPTCVQHFALQVSYNDVSFYRRTSTLRRAQS